MAKSGSEAKRQKKIDHAARAAVARQKASDALGAAIRMENHRRMQDRVLAVLLMRLGQTPESQPIDVLFSELGEAPDIGMKVLEKGTPHAHVLIGLVPRGALDVEDAEQVDAAELQKVEEVAEVADASTRVDALAERPARAWYVRAWHRVQMWWWGLRS